MWTCPYCGNPQAAEAFCDACRRNPSAPRRICPACKRMTPKDEKLCCHCAHKFTHELSWKIPVIIVVIIVATALQFLIRGIR
jgi:RNA polymerase subunit RPABC4/transcription elongation factor Spt4